MKEIFQKIIKIISKKNPENIDFIDVNQEFKFDNELISKQLITKDLIAVIVNV